LQPEGWVEILSDALEKLADIKQKFSAATVAVVLIVALQWCYIGFNVREGD